MERARLPPVCCWTSGRRIIPLGVDSSKYDERGLLGLAFHPDFKKNGLFYTYATERAKGIADFSTMDLNNPSNGRRIPRTFCSNGARFETLKAN